MLSFPCTGHRGEIWTADLNPTRGHEQAGARPVLIISDDGFNRGAADLVFAIPLTHSDRGIPLHIPLDPPEGGVSQRSFAMCEMLRSLAKDRLCANPWGSVSPETMEKIEEILRILMKL